MDRHQRLQRQTVDSLLERLPQRSLQASSFQTQGFGVQKRAATSAPATKAELWDNYQATKQLFENGARALSIQAKLTIGQPGDKYEQEADSVAERVMAMSEPAQVQREELLEEEEELKMKPLAETISPLVQREELPEEEEELQMKPEGNAIQRAELPEEEEELQMKSVGNSIQREELPEEEELQMKQSAPSTQTATPDLESQLGSSKGGGSPLSDDVRSFMEPRFGADFSGVRVHTGSDAVQMNRDVNAQAFAHGQDIYFGSGKAPGKDALTAHELTHVLQQQVSQVQPMLQCEGEGNVASASEKLRKIQGMAMFALLPELNTLSVDNPGILDNESTGHLVGGYRLVVAMRAVKAKSTDSSVNFLKKNKISLRIELPKDQVDSIWRFLGFTPLIDIQGLPMDALLSRLSTLPEEALEEEEGSRVGGPRLITAMLAVRARKEHNLIDFLTANKRSIEALPADQFTNILTFLAVPVEKEKSNKTTNTDLKVNVVIVNPASIGIPGEGKMQGKGEIQLDHQSPPDAISKFEKRLLKEKSIINGVVLDPDTREIIGYRLSATTGLTRLVDREGEVAWENEIGLQQPAVDPIDFAPTPGAVVGVAKGVAKAGAGVAGKLILKGTIKGVLTKEGTSGGGITLAAIIKMRSVSQALKKGSGEAAQLLKTQWGWTGTKVWKELVSKVRNGGTIKNLSGIVPTKSEAIKLIEEAGGKIERIEGPHLSPNPHNFNHINYTTPFGTKGTLQIQDL